MSVTVFSSGCVPERMELNLLSMVCTDRFWGPDHWLYLQLFDFTPLIWIAAKVLNKGAKVLNKGAKVLNNGAKLLNKGP